MMAALWNVLALIAIAVVVFFALGAVAIVVQSFSELQALDDKDEY